MTPSATARGQRLARNVAGLALLITAVVTGACGSPTAQAPPTSAASTMLAPSPSKPSEPATIATPSPSFQTYVVAQGDTLPGIADRFGLTLDQLLAANPSITDPNRVSVGEVLDIPALSSALLIEAASEGGPFVTSSLHLRLGEEPMIRVAGDPLWVDEQVHWQTSESATEPIRWSPYGSDGFDATGHATRLVEQQDRPYVWRAYRARLPASGTHPELVSKPLVIEWGGTGPCPAEKVEGEPP